MPSTPISGQISFSDVKSLTTDKLGYTPPVNVSIGTLASVVRQFGQKAPSSNNIAFSNFYLSTIAGYTITTSGESYQKYYQTKDDGSITVKFRSNTFKKRAGDSNYYVKVTTQEKGDGIIDTEVKLIDWNDSTTNNFIKFSNQNAGIYIVTVTDLTTGALIGTSEVTVKQDTTAAFAPPKESYYFNA